MKAPWPVLVALSAAMISRVDAATICVNPGGTGGCLASIQAAMNAASLGDRIEVAAGTYVEDVNVPFGTKQIVRGAGPGATVIQGSLDVGFPGALDAAGFTIDAGGSIGMDVAQVVVKLADCEITGASQALLGERTYLVSFDRCAIHGNATGIFIDTISDSPPTRLVIKHSTISGSAGRGILMQGGSVRVQLEDSTISGNGGNAIESFGFGFSGRPRIRARRSTIVGNARGIVDSTPPPARLRVLLDGTIIANSTAGPDVIGPAMNLRSRGYNLIETLDPGTTLHGAGPDLLGVDPVVGPLQNNGGPTETHELLGGSPALEFVAKSARCRQPDQRGVTREPVPCDIGAFEAP